MLWAVFITALGNLHAAPDPVPAPGTPEYAQLKTNIETKIKELSTSGQDLPGQRNLYDWLKANVEEKAKGPGLFDQPVDRSSILASAGSNGCQGLPHAILTDGYFNRYLPAENEIPARRSKEKINKDYSETIWNDVFATTGGPQNIGCLVFLIDARIEKNKAESKPFAALQQLRQAVIDFPRASLLDKMKLGCYIHTVVNDTKEYPELMRDLNICMMEKMLQRLNNW